MRTKKKVVPNNIETSSLKRSENSEPKPFIFRLVNYSDNAVWGILSLTLVAGFLVVGVPLISAIQIWCALILYSAPFYLTTFIKLARIRSIDSVVRVVIAFGLGSISLALIFGFTPIAMHPWLFWTIGIGLSAFSYLHFRVTGRNFNIQSPEGNQSSSKSMLSLLMIPVLVVAAALAQRISWPVYGDATTWLPDDVPIFASWSETLSLGGMNNEIIEGFTLKYHWLTYSFVGGLDRLFSDSFFGGSIQVAPVIAWSGLALGALAISRLHSRSFVPSSLAVTTVLFSSTVGLLQFSRVSVGGTVVSPSHLIAASWVIVIILLGFLIYPSSMNIPTSSFLFLVLGFSLALTKFSAFAVSLVGLAVLSYFLSFKTTKWSSSRQPLRGIALTGIFALGGLIAYLLFIKGGEVELAIDSALIFDAQMGMGAIGLQLLPLGASAFSLVVLLLPVITLSKRYLSRDPLVVAAFVISLMGLVATVLLELRDSNETWFIAEGMAIILPISSVLVYFVVKNLGVSSIRQKSIWVILGIFSLVSSLFLLSEGENPALLLRPWLTPSILVIISFAAAITVILVAFGKGATRQGSGFLIRTIGSLMVVAMFVTSIPYGMGLRATAAITEVQGRATVSLERDLWLKSAQDLIDSGRLDSSNSNIAVYSTSRGEETLVRWIAYLAGKKSYFLRNDDLLRYIYVSTDSSDMLTRELDVQKFIEDGSRSSCLALQQAGISQIWVTPNANFDGSGASEAFVHALIDVDCDSRE